LNDKACREVLIGREKTAFAGRAYDASPSGAVGRSFSESEGVGAEISAPFSFFADDLNRSVGLSGKPFWVDAPSCCSGRFEKNFV
jgi:hypothetical protein